MISEIAELTFDLSSHEYTFSSVDSLGQSHPRFGVNSD